MRARLWRGGALIDRNDISRVGRGWGMTEARDSTNAGMIVVNGQHGERRRAFLLSPGG